MKMVFIIVIGSNQQHQSLKLSILNNNPIHGLIIMKIMINDLARKMKKMKNENNK